MGESDDPDSSATVGISSKLSSLCPVFVNMTGKKSELPLSSLTGVQLGMGLTKDKCSLEVGRR